MTGERRTDPRPRSRQRHIAHLALTAPDTDTDAETDGERYADIVDVLSGITPHVKAVPPDAVQLDLTSALRYFDLSPYHVVQLAQLRLKALHGVDAGAGLAGNRMLAAMAADTAAPGHTVWVPAERATAWLRPRPVTALPEVGRSMATTLGRYGLHTIGQIADLPAATLQRLLGVGRARLLTERAHGHDPRPVVPDEPAARLTAELALERDCLDPERQHRSVLGLVEHLGHRLRGAGQVAGRVTLTVRYADRSTSTRAHRLAEPTGHSPALASAALGLLAGLGLQRARVRGFTVRAEELRPADTAHRQLSLDSGDDRARAAEAVADRIRRRFGAAAVGPPSWYGHPDQPPRVVASTTARWSP
ncbi:DNA polymerase Y family protein [Streptomyces profundus]|uniref:DNA polymerase Y family protein n=1 Tax=Streptomyces profundus TaxID=2867410 RepID=UPI001D164F24|nr:ImpB/MucB/SamB family protein [Streptomyces sp. MA3_2.13]UED83410.1 ImpB/MucB/SamB family protein [Streptomyces sp. MA3_2.13]